MLSDVVGDRIAAIRRRAGISRDEIARRCTDHGWQMTAAVLTNIETGRRQQGVRRREVTIDEVAVLAHALDVPPVLLIYPVGVSDSTEITSGETGAPWTGVRWWMGEVRLDGASTDDDPSAAPVVLYRRHQALVDLLSGVGTVLSPWQRRHVPQDAERLVELRSTMRQLGITPPDLPAEAVAAVGEVAPHLVAALGGTDKSGSQTSTSGATACGYPTDDSD